MNQIELLNEIVDKKITAIIGGIFAEALDKELLGKKIDKKIVSELSKIAAEHHINPAGEGGEIETTVLDAPVFKKKIEISRFETNHANNAGTFSIIEAKLVSK